VMGNSTVSDSYVKHRQIKIRFGLFGQRWWFCYEWRKATPLWTWTLLLGSTLHRIKAC
jgi:hypothetical protein